MNRLVIGTLTLIVLTTSVLVFTHLPENSFSWDNFGYYLYLPATFIQHDLGLAHFEWVQVIMDKYEPSSTFYQLNHQENGNWVIKYTLGNAWLYLPFFAIAHLIALVTDFDANGFSLPYQVSINLGMIFYFGLGLYFLSKLLLRYFSSISVAITLLLLFFGTNLLQVSWNMTISPHIGISSLYCALLYFTDNWHRSFKLKDSIIIGVSTGLIILNRPTEIVCLAIPVLWNFNSIQNQIQRLLNYKKQLIITGIIVFVIGFTQLIYWKITTGKFLYYSYDNPGEGLDLFTPHLFNFLFSFRKGWFIYTPLGLTMVWGFYKLYKQDKGLFIPLFITMLFSLYLMSSWTTWWYAGGSYSSRTMVNIYPVLALPLAAFVQNTLLNRKWLFAVVVPLVVLNLFQTWQWKHRIIDPQRMTMKSYFNIFGQTHVDPDWEKDLLVYRSPESVQSLENPSDYKLIQTLQFESDDFKTIDSNSFTGLLLNGDQPYSKAIEKPFHDITSKDHAWLIADATVYIPESYSESSPLLVLHFMHGDGVYKYRSFEPSDFNDHKGDTVHFHYEYLTPEVRSKSDLFKCYLWQRSKSSIYLIDLKVQVLEKQ